MDQTLSLVLFSGTDDKLNAASVLTAGAAAIGRPVHLFLQYWALDAFRADRIADDHGVAPEGGPEGLQAVAAPAAHHRGRPGPAGRRRGGRDRLLARRRRRTGRLHLKAQKGTYR